MHRDVKYGSAVSLLARRRFLRRSGAAAAAAALYGGLNTPTALAAPATYTDPKKHAANPTDILNFALNLEYLEAEYYLRATTGSGLADSEISGDGSSSPGKRDNKAGTPGAVTGGAQVPFQNALIGEIASDIANDEHNHVLFLRDALGNKAVARPAIDFTNAFTAAAIAAGIITQGQTFDPFSDDDSFLLGAFLFEDVGVTAYHGAATHIGDGSVLQAAAGILAVEAYHAGAIRTMLASRGMTVASDVTAANDIANLRAKVGGGNDAVLIDTNGDFILAPADNNGIAFARTFNEVLSIVYLGAAAGTGGGFFPDRLNGPIS